MIRRILIAIALLALPSIASAREAFHGWCELGNQSVVTQGLSSTTKAQQSNPQCVVTVFVHGGGLATIYSDNNNTPLANPFQAQTNGLVIFYANDGRYDIQFSPGTTYIDWLLCDPFTPGAVCSGASSGAHNLLSTTHLDTIPFSPPVRGDLITAQNLTSPTSVNPSWARLPLGTNGQVLLSNGIDALWGSLTAGSGITITNNTGSLTISSSGGAGCTLPGVTDTAVVSEHPVGTCYDSAHWTWDDGVNRQNMLAGNGTNTAAADSAGIVRFIFTFGSSNSSFGTNIFTLGASNTLGENTSPVGPLYTIGSGNNVCDQGTEGSAGCGGLFTFGANNFVDGSSNFVLGSANLLFETAPVGGSAMPRSTFVVGQTNDIEFQGTGTSSFLSNIGLLHTGTQTNDILAVGYNSQVTDIFMVGFHNRGSSTGSGSGSQFTSWQDTYVLGEGNTFTSSTLAVVSKNYVVGDTNSITGSGGFGTSDVTLLGDHNTITSSSAVVSNSGAFGSTNAIANCIHCYAIGENASLTSSNNSTLILGMNAVPGLVITSASAHDNVRRSPLAFASLPSCAAGTEGSFASVNDSTTSVAGATITGGGANHVLGYCNGTNWIVTGASTSSFPDVKIIPAANCPNATAGGGWSYATSTWTAACRAGTNNLGGALQLAPSGGGAAQFRIELPLDWNTASQPFIRIEYASGANTTGTVIWTVASACTKADGSVTDDPAFNSESAFATQTMAAANRAWSQTGQFTAITSGNSCVPGGGIIMRLTLSGTASSAINAYQAVVTVPRTPVVQAN